VVEERIEKDALARGQQRIRRLGQPGLASGASRRRCANEFSGAAIDGNNEIVTDYNSALSNVQLDRGVARVTPNANGWWHYNIDYLPFVPKQAKLIPFVEAHYVSQNGGVGGTMPATPALSLGSQERSGPSSGSRSDVQRRHHGDGHLDGGRRTLSVTDPSAAATGRLVNGSFALVHFPRHASERDADSRTQTRVTPGRRRPRASLRGAGNRRAHSGRGP
jgi:hypothetical protein